jgi:hypothetical protein
VRLLSTDELAAGSAAKALGWIPRAGEKIANVSVARLWPVELV